MSRLNSLGKTTLATIVIAAALIAIALITLLPLPHAVAATTSSSTSSNYFTIVFKNVPPVLINNTSTEKSISVVVKPNLAKLQSVASAYLVDIAVLFGGYKATIVSTGPQEFMACYKYKSTTGKYKYNCLSFKIEGATFYTTASGYYIESPQLGISTLFSFNIVITFANATKDYENIYLEVFAHPSSTTYSTTYAYTTLNTTTMLVLTPSYYKYYVSSFTISSSALKNGYVVYYIESITPAIENYEKTNLYEAMGKVCIYYKNGVSTSNFPYTEISEMTPVACAFKELSGKTKYGPYEVEPVTVNVTVKTPTAVIGKASFKYYPIVTSSGLAPISESLKINTTELSSTELKALEEHPNVTISFLFIGPYKIPTDTAPAKGTFYSIFAFKPPVVKKVVIEYSGKTVKELEGTFYIPGSATEVNANVTVQAYANITSPKAYMKLPSEYPYETSSVPFGVVKMYVNNTAVSVPSISSKFSVKELDETGLANYSILIKDIDVSKVKYRTKITIELEELNGYKRKFNVTFYIAKELTPPSAPTFVPIKEGPYVVGLTDLSAKDKVGILYYIVQMPKFNVTLGSNMTASYYMLCTLNGSKVGCINYTASLVSPLKTYAKILENVTKYGGVLVGNGKIYILPPLTSPTLEVKVYAVNYGGITSKPSTLTVNYGTEKYDSYYIMYLAKGWNIFAIPGAVPTGWGKAFASIIKSAYGTEITALWCASPGPLVSVKQCTLAMLENPTPVTSGILSPYVFFAYLNTSKPVVYIIPVKFKVLKPVPSPLMITVTVKPGVWNAVPVALTMGGSIENIVTLTAVMYGVPVTFVVYRPLSPSLIMTVGRCTFTSSGPQWVVSSYVLPGEVLLTTSTATATVQITPS